MTAETHPQPLTAFDWSIYGDATFAGLSALIPVPLADWASEEFFRRRMPSVIAEHRGRKLPSAIVEELNEGGRGVLATCLMLPFKFVYELITRLSRKLLYFLAVKEATDKVSGYWHRAFLIDYMLQQGHLQDKAQARAARQAQARVLNRTHSPLRQLAHRLISDTRHLSQSVRRARQGEEDEQVQQARSYLRERWHEFDDYLVKLAGDYDRAYQQVRSQQQEVAA
ncbi:MAG: hypothetical protein ACLFVO_13290 [Chloroflexaceae bacterium]